MGWNTTVVILNDHLDQIERDTEFGKNLVFAIRRLHDGPCVRPLTISSGGAAIAAVVVETHDGYEEVDVRVGLNRGAVITADPRRER
jgi:hypothetical protein